MRTRVAAACCAAMIWGGAAVALEDGAFGVFLEDAAGDRWRVGSVSVSEGKYTATMADEGFGDYFLSMRPFRCLEGPEKLWCHVPYPYEITRDLSGELTDLEYDFLFVWKPAGEYGINLWNGVYYVLEEHGTGLRGAMYEMDMNLLAVPPEAGNLRPIRDVDLTEADRDSHWLPQMLVLPD
ncbi:MAG: hypothetical protein QNJ09_10395 [Paracoccaceae bacterium]|nr:hypothetical protein [Paracoccaceae bacterium]